MFGLLYNFYKFCKKKSERRITLAVLGLDNAGKTTLLNTIKGEVQAETTPTFGFTSSTLQEGKYKIEAFDLGGGKTFRSVWSKYLAEVHAIVYVVDAADAQRFEESKKALHDVLECHYMREKAILVFANKQDLLTALTAAEVVKGLGLATCRNNHNVIPCRAKTPVNNAVDERLREGLRWLIGSIDREYGKLDTRVQADTAEVRLEEARKKKERDERIRRQREERLRQQKEEEEERAREVERANALHNGQGPALLTIPADGQQEPQQAFQPLEPQKEGKKVQALHQGVALGLPHTIESPGKLPIPRLVTGTPAIDLGTSPSDQGTTAAPQVAGTCGGDPASAAVARSSQLAAPSMGPPSRPLSAQSHASEGGGGVGAGAPAASLSSAAPGRPGSAGRTSVCSGGGGGGSGCPSRPASAGSRAEGSAAEGGGGEETAGGQPHRWRLTKGSSGGLPSGAASDGAPRGSFSIVAQNNKVVPVGIGSVQDASG